MFGMGTGVSPPPWPPEIGSSDRKIHRDPRKKSTTEEGRLSTALRARASKQLDQASRPISTGRLNTLLCLHLRPINLLVSEGPLGSLPCGRSHLEVGFALRCFQRLSDPDIATRRCRWHDNRYTRGPSVPVLSYEGQLPSNLLRPRWIGTELSHDVLNPAHVPL